MRCLNFPEIISSMFAKRKVFDETVKTLKPVYCTDGTSLSIQASRNHYCFPRNNEGPYTQVEVGFPSVKPPESWREYCDGNFDLKPCDTVYCYVPLKVVSEFIEQHGGIRAEEAPQLVLPEPKLPVVRSFIEQRRYNLTLEDMGLQS